jgi:hypothetical protein
MKLRQRMQVFWAAVALCILFAGCASTRAQELRQEFSNRAIASNNELLDINRDNARNLMIFKCESAFGAVRQKTESDLAIATTDLERRLIMELHAQRVAEAEAELREEAAIYVEQLEAQEMISNAIVAINQAADAEIKSATEIQTGVELNDLRNLLYQIIDQQAEQAKPETPTAPKEVIQNEQPAN